MKGKEIRRHFIEYFERQGHQHLESSSLVPHNDPTLLFANAGMNQFKDYFTGKDTPKKKRAVTAQKCVRAGGKHNDLENVGFTARHHTFFEMLGNFSFGDYFKKDAIHFAWEFLTQDLKISKDKLYVTVHEGDDEALKIWNEQEGVPLERIFKKGNKDNFWEMGETGPCGPCSEIFYDHGPQYTSPSYDPKTAKDILDDDARYVEIWNLVFMQFEKYKEGDEVKQRPLPNPSIDTGAGLERVAAVMQGKYWNYDTDLFTPIFNKLEELCGKKYDSNSPNAAYMRVVADHIRSSVMLITDGVIPSNEGRGYVLRRIIRRAVRYLRELGLKEISFYKLIPTVFEILGDEYPKNKANMALAEKLLEFEERKFLETLDQGLKFLDDAIATKLQQKTLPGEIAFKLYDTYGLPVDLTEIILREKNLELDQKGFEEAMQKQRELSKKSWKGGAGVDNKIFYQIKDKTGATKFLGYEHCTHKATLLAKENVGEMTALIFNQTPFYGESGGQVGDTGVIMLGEHIIAHIDETQKPIENLWVHYSKDADALEIGKEYNLKVNSLERELIRRNHTATHLLQAALVRVLGDHIKQAGSMVSAERLRFDFTHPEALKKEQIKEVERIVNEQIQNALSVKPEELSIDEARARGATALFGEKYGNVVRMIPIGDAKSPFSLELCGGTHVSNTNEIGLFTILIETSLSSGIRRIEAITSDTALARLQERSNLLEQIESSFSVKGPVVWDRVQALQKEVKDKQKEIETLKEKLQVVESEKLFANAEKLGPYPFKVSEVEAGSDLKALSDLFTGRYESGIALLYSITPDKKQVDVILRSHKNNQQIHCSNILKQAFPIIEGRGGGKNDMAQGRGQRVESINEFISKVKALIHA